jgi:hypothetical protein
VNLPLCESCYAGGAVQTVRMTRHLGGKWTETELVDLCESCYAVLFPVRSRLIASRYLLERDGEREVRVPFSAEVIA